MPDRRGVATQCTLHMTGCPRSGVAGGGTGIPGRPRGACVARRRPHTHTFDRHSNRLLIDPVGAARDRSRAEVPAWSGGGRAGPGEGPAEGTRSDTSATGPHRGP